MADLINLNYAKALLRITDTNSDALLTTLVSAASAAVEKYCRQPFAVGRYVELYDASTQPWLMLRHAPVVQLNSVTVYPEQPNVLLYTPDNFDVRPQLGRVAFKPAVPGAFFTEYAAAMTFPGWGVDVTQVDYYAGYGFLTTSVGAIAAGPATVTPALTTGYANGQPWQIGVGSVLIIDSATAAEEVVTVTVVAPGTFTATFANNHAAGCALCGMAVPNDVQLATGLLTANIYNQPDLTKLRESMGKTIGYEYAVRPGTLFFTPEILALLNPYRDVVV